MIKEIFSSVWEIVAPSVLYLIVISFVLGIIIRRYINRLQQENESEVKVAKTKRRRNYQMRFK